MMTPDHQATRQLARLGLLTAWRLTDSFNHGILSESWRLVPGPGRLTLPEEAQAWFTVLQTQVELVAFVA